MQIDGYIRVSRVMGRDGEAFYSPDDQRRSIEGWAQAHGHDVIAWHTDLDKSGRKDDRPGFQAMMRRVDARETEGVVVAKLDRLSRSVTNGLAAIKRMTDNGARFVSVAEGVDPTTRFGKLNTTMVLAMAEWLSDGIQEGWGTAVGNAVERGAWPAVIPFGYAKDDDARLHPDPHEAPYLQAIFERRGNGHTWQSIADWLNAEGVKPRRAEQWNSSTVKDICRHDVYLGIVRKGEHVNEDAHDPLVDRAAWHRAQNVNGLMPTTQNGNGYPLAGLLRCAACGFTMAGSTYKPKGKPAVPMYGCKRHHGGGDCPAPSTINASRIEPHVERVFMEMVGRLEMEPVQDAPELADAEAALTRTEGELGWWATNTEARETFGETAYLAGARERRDAVEHARERVVEARRRATGIDLPPVVELTKMWPDLSRAERRRLMSAAIDCVFVRRGRHVPVEERVRVVGKGEAPAGLPSKGRSAPIRSYDW